MDLTSPSTCIHSSHADSAQHNGMCEERGQRECFVVKKKKKNTESCKFSGPDFTFLTIIWVNLGNQSFGELFLFVR